MRTNRNFAKRAVSAIHSLGFCGTARFLVWFLKNQLVKSIIHWQDALGLYSYADWIRENEPPCAMKTAGGHDANPLATFFIMADWQSDVLEKLQFTLDSICKQTLPNWECIVFFPAQHQHAAEFSGFGSDGAAEPRIKFLPAQAIGPDQLLSEILPQAHGEWIIRTRAGDAHSKALLDCLSNQNGEIVFWDEDRLENKQRCAPFFKPDWSPELWLSVDLLHCSAIRRSLASRAAAESGRAALLARCIATAKRIDHIPAVLTHCRASAWENEGERVAHTRHVSKYLEIKGIAGSKVSVKPDGSLRVTWPTPADKVSIIIPNKNKYLFLERLLGSMFEKTAYKNYEVIIVDDHSTDPDILDFYQSLSHSAHEVRIVKGSQPFNYSQACNLGAKNASGAYLLFLNNDVEIIDPDWLSELMLFASLEEVGIVGGKLLYPNRTIQHAGIIVGLEGHAHHVFLGQSLPQKNPFGSIEWVRNYSAVTGACMMLRRQVYQKIGGFDESFQLVFNDVEICLRAIRAGYRVVYTPEACLIHHEGQSRGRFIPREDILLGYQKLLAAVEVGDPSYNKNLSLAWHVPTYRRRWEGSAVERLRAITRYFSKL